MQNNPRVVQNSTFIRKFFKQHFTDRLQMQKHNNNYLEGIIYWSLIVASIFWVLT